MQKGILLVFFCFLATALSAQSGEFLTGYIVSTAQDTTYGYIKDVNRTRIGEEIQFKTDLAQADPTTYTPEELSAFFFEPSFYFSAQYIELDGQSQKRFLRKLVEGYASLYQYVYDGVGYLMQKESGEQVQLKKENRATTQKYVEDRAYVGKIKYLFQDCPAFVTYDEKIGYNENDLIQVVKEYNACVRPDVPSKVLNEKRKLRFKWGPTIGMRWYNLETLDTQAPNRELNESRFGYQVGLLGNLYFFEKLSLQVGVIYVPYSLSYDYFIANDIDIFEVEHEFSNLNIPINIRYKFLNRGISPYVFIGAGPGVFLDGTVKVVNTRTTSGEVISDETTDLFFKRLITYEGGIGVSWILGTGNELDFEVKYMNTEMAVGKVLVDYYLESIRANLTFLF